MQTSEDWEWLVASSEYLAAVAVQELLEEQKIFEKKYTLFNDYN